MGPAGLGQREGVREGVKEMHTFLRFTPFQKKMRWGGYWGVLAPTVSDGVCEVEGQMKELKNWTP